ncbi:MAG: MoxR family ATPase [Bacillota bacterium]|nr:MAG: MoxR family ATPase [Bacillota bacterium]
MAAPARARGASFLEDAKNATTEWLRKAFELDGYVAGQEILIAVYLALRLEKPILIEGAPGVGKTEIAKVLARIFGTDLIRLQCYEGLDESKALYEWDYQKQLLHIQLLREAGCIPEESELFSEDYLLERPLLKAIRAERRPVLLIDEVDKCDPEFEAFLFEVLSDFTVSVPELGTIRARQIPIVVLTSNNERELSDGLRRRCVYLFIEYPSVEKELRIVRSRVPEASDKLARDVACVVARVRTMDLRKQPSIAETLDWTRALLALGVEKVNDQLLAETATMLLKNRDDVLALREAAAGGRWVTEALEACEPGRPHQAGKTRRPPRP